MKMINTNEKRIKEQIQKEDCCAEAAGGYRHILWLRVLRTVLFICFIVIVCSCCALCEIHRLKKQAILNDSEFDKIRIYIDQGHNPAPHHNNGAQGNGLYEQDVTFEIGRMLADLLVADGRFDVCLSRPDESVVLGENIASSLQARVQGAADFEADYFISLHINSYTQESVNGIEVFVSGVDSESYSLGRLLLQGMVDSTNLKNRGMKQDADLYVLKNTTMPAVLLEMGFLSNVNDAALLSEHPELFAEGVYDGILHYFESIYMLDFNILLWTIGISTMLLIGVTVALLKLKKQGHAAAQY